VLLLLHPTTGTADIWKHQLTAFSEAGYRVVAFSRRGAGRSSAQPRGLDPSNQDISILLDHLDVPSAHFVGSAGGGVHALNYALHRPERVKSLVLNGSMAGMSAADVRNLVTNFMPPSDAPVELKDFGPSYRYANPEGVQEWLRLEEQSRAHALRKLPKNERREVFSSILDLFGEGAAIESVKQKTLLLYGGADLIAPPAYARTIVERFENADLVIIPEAGHGAYWEAPFVFNSVVLDFLSELDMDVAN
jgi:pimeloyl-ACP methyl ester carboxylesterase